MNILDQLSNINQLNHNMSKILKLHQENYIHYGTLPLLQSNICHNVHKYTNYNLLIIIHLYISIPMYRLNNYYYLMFQLYNLKPLISIPDPNQQAHHQHHMLAHFKNTLCLSYLHNQLLNQYLLLLGFYNT